MSNNLYTVGFSLSQGKQKFRLATLRFNSNTEELFYHFAHLSGKKTANIFDASHRKIGERGNIDHISFHKDGTIHITHKKHSNGKFRHFERKLEDNIFYSLGEYGFYPLFINSFYLKQHDSFADILPKFELSTKELEIECPSNIQFNNLSICLFICRTIDASRGIKVYLDDIDREVLMPPDNKQMNMWFDACNIKEFAIPNQKYEILDAFNGWKIIPVFSFYVNKKDKNREKRLNEYISFGLFPPKEHFLKKSFGEIFEK